MTPDERQHAISALRGHIAILRRVVSSSLSTAGSLRHGDEDERLTWLERAVVNQREVARLHQELTDLYEPCRACGRKVSSPCHDAEGYYTNGPWDSQCEAQIKGKNE